MAKESNISKSTRSTNWSTMDWRVVPTKIKIYNYLIDGKFQTWIAKTLGVNKSYVSRVTRQLLDEGYIKKAINKRRHIVYRATRYKLTGDTPVKKNGLHWECKSTIEIDVHHISYKFKVVDRPRRKIIWDKENHKMRGLVHKYLFWPQEIGRITIRYQENKSEHDSVVIWVPSIKIPADQRDQHEDILYDNLMRASAWMQRLLLCRLSLPQVYRKPHYAVPVREPELRKFLKENTIKIGDVHADSSPPSLEPHFESTNFEKTRCYIELPDRVLSLEEQMAFMMNQQKQLVESQHEMTESIRELTENISEFMGFRRKMEAHLEKESKEKMYS